MANNFNLQKSIRRMSEKISQIAIDTHSQPAVAKPNETWVKYSVTQKLTGWNQNDLRWARRNNLVKTKPDGKGISYLLESLNPNSIKK